MTFLKKQKEEPIQDTPTPETASGTTEFDEELTMEEMEAKVQEVMEKYDRESNTRKWVGLPNSVIRYLMVAFAIYCVLINFLFNWETRIERASFVGCIVVFIFLLFPARKNAAKKQNYVPWYDVLLAIAGGVSYFYFVFNCTKIINQGIMIGTTEMIFGIIGILVTLEACRRSVGFPIVIVASVFIIYAMTQRTLLLNVYNLFYTTEGVIGTPIRACSTFIVLFVMFGSFLGKTGITDFFIELANSIAGSSDGGPAKVAVISSALCGMVSGSSVGNTVTTGAITIPMMKRTGYKPEFAGAVEAAASTGGQIMPPIMGAAAFLMAEYASTPYSTIAVKAIIPAFLYFSGVFIAVHLEAKKTGLKGLSKEHLPKFFQTLFTKGYLLVPLIALVIFILKTTMAMAAIIGTLLAIVVSLFRKETRITPSKFFDALQDTAKSTLTVGRRLRGCRYDRLRHHNDRYRYQTDFRDCRTGGRQFVYRDVLDHGDLHHPRHGRSDHRKLCHYGDHLRADPDADEYAGTLRAHVRILLRYRCRYHASGCAGSLRRQCDRRLQTDEDRA